MEEGGLERLLRTLSRRIKERRQILNLTQERLADLAGVSLNFVSRLEVAGRVPSLGTLVRLADALGVDVPYLLSGEREVDKSGVCRHLEHSLSTLTDADREFVVQEFGHMVEHFQGKR